MPRLYSPQEVAEWYEENTGRARDRGFGRIFAILEYLDNRPELELEDLTLENHQDPLWNQRNCRQPNEALAVMIGYSNPKGGGNERWWVFPRDHRHLEEVGSE